MSPSDIAVEVPTLHFAAGLPGFPEQREFALVYWEDDDDSPFSVLTSIDEPSIEFLVVPPMLFFPDYVPEVDDNTAEVLGIESSEDALLLVIVTVPDDPAAATANLLAPIVVNRHTRQAVQAVLDDTRHPLRAPLFGG